LSSPIEIQYFPSIGFFYHGIIQGKIIIEGCENYQKGGLRNRCFIAGGGGKMGLSVPLIKGKNQQTPIKEVKIDFSSNWQKIHLRTIQAAYGSAPFFEHYIDWVEHCLFQKNLYLFDYVMEIILSINKKMNFNIDFMETETFQHKHDIKCPEFPSYHQVFEDRNGFISNLSILDLVMNLGNESKLYLLNIPRI
jgi:hypothetical protein